ncbi:MAG: ABC transporter permease [Thermoplasmata archaeon]|nr:MAG: ABC transporter permease [Thermoplasmata archaeon]
MRQTFVKKGLRELWKHRYKYLLLIVVLALGVAMFTSLSNMLDSRKASLEAIYSESKFMDLQVQFEYGLTTNISTVEQVLSQPELSNLISDVEYRLVYDVFINYTEGNEIKTAKGIVMGYQVFGPDGNLLQLDVNRPLYYVDNPPEFSSSDANQCFMERKFARTNDLSSGDVITVVKGSQVVGLEILEHVNIPEYFAVVEEGSFFPQQGSLGVLMLPIETAQEIYLGTSIHETLVNDIVFLLNDPDNLESIREIISQEFADFGIPVKTIGKEENPARAFMKGDLESDEGILTVFPIIIFTVAAFGLIMALRRMIQTHKAQIGVFKALGVPNRVVLIYFATIGVFIAVFGCILGYLSAIPLDIVFENLARDLLDSAIYEYNFVLGNYLIAVFVSVVICLACTLIPAWLALRIKPIDAIQQREGLSKRSVGRISRRVGRSRRTPIPLKLTMRNLFRRPGRTLTTVLGIALSLALFLSFVILLDSFVVYLDATETNRWDYEVGLEGFSPMTLTSDWKQKNQDIESICHGILLPTTANKGSQEKEAVVYALEGLDNVYKMEYESGGFENGEIVISFYHADKLNLKVGDTIELEVPWLDMATGYEMVTRDLTVSGIHGNHIGYYVFMDLETLQSITNLTGMANIVYLNTVDGKESTVLENTLITTPGVSSVAHRSLRENLMEPYLELIVSTVIMLGLLSMALTAAIVYNLFMINAEEKKRDYATMKTLGTSIRRLSYLIFIEAGFITTFGIILGTIGGYFMAIGMIMGSPDLEILNFDILFSWSGLIFGTLIIVFVVVLVSILTIRYISRINIANVIRERSTG